MSTTPRLFIEDLPAVGQGARRAVIDCKHATTQVIYINAAGGLEVTDEMAARMALAKHHSEESCRCTAKLWRRYFGAELGELVLVRGNEA